MRIYKIAITILSLIMLKVSLFSMSMDYPNPEAPLQEPKIKIGIKKHKSWSYDEEMLAKLKKAFPSGEFRDSRVYPNAKTGYYIPGKKYDTPVGMEVYWYDRTQMSTYIERDAPYKEITFSVTWYKTGELCSIRRLKNGRKYGLCAEWHTNGICEFVRYREKPTDPWKYEKGWHENGNMKYWIIRESIPKLEVDGCTYTSRTAGFYWKEDGSRSAHSLSLFGVNDKGKKVAISFRDGKKSHMVTSEGVIRY